MAASRFHSGPTRDRNGLSRKRDLEESKSNSVTRLRGFDRWAWSAWLLPLACAFPAFASDLTLPQNHQAVGKAKLSPTEITAAFQSLRARRQALIEEIIGPDPLATYAESCRYEHAANWLPPRPGTAYIEEAEDLLFGCNDPTMEFREVKRTQMKYVDFDSGGVEGFAGAGYVMWSAPSRYHALTFEPQLQLRTGVRYRLDAALARGPQSGVVRFRFEPGSDDDPRIAGEGQIDTRFSDESPTGFIPLFEFELLPGESSYQDWRIDLPLSNNPRDSGAVVGIDRVRFTVIGDERAWLDEVDLIAERHGLDPERLARCCVDWRRTSRAKWQASLHPPEESWKIDWVGDADCTIQGEKFVTEGCAFQGAPNREITTLDVPPRIRSEIDSSVDSECLAGSFTTASFLVDSNWLFVEVRGNDSRIVLHSDAFLGPRGTDGYSTITLECGDVWNWRTIDVSALRGTRARLEFRDDGPGWIAVRDIVGADEKKIGWYAMYRSMCGSAVETPEDARSFLRSDGRYVYSDPRFDRLLAEFRAIEREL